MSDRRYLFLSWAVALAALLAAAGAVEASGQLMVAPTRVVFDDRTRSAQVTLVNTGAEQATFRIEFVRRRMRADGGFEEILQPRDGERFADEMVRFSPRQVTLAPGQSQVVRLLLRKPAALDAGEYRSHLLFRSVPELGGGIEALDRTDNREISIQLVPVLAISIPVIVRHGATHAQAALSGAELIAGPAPALRVGIARSGNRSLFGDLQVIHFADSGERRVLGQANGVAVYTPLEKREFRLPLYLPPEVSLDAGRLQVVYRARPEEGGAVLAQHELSLR